MLRRTYLGYAVPALALLALPGGPAMAQQEQGAAACPVAVLPPEFAAWASPAPLSAAADEAGLGSATLSVGTAVDATLLPRPGVRYLVRPEKPGGTVSHGGMLAFDVKEAGTYRVALAGGAWIDVIEKGRSVISSAHGHGPECSGIRKMVDFPLAPGRHVLQIASSGTGTLRLLIVRLP